MTKADPKHLTAITRRGRAKARTFQRASALLQLQAGHTLLHIAEALQVSRQSVARWRDGYLQAGLQVLAEKPRSGRPVRLNGKQRARITALACSTPPAGRAHWTLRLLADQVVELGYCGHLSHTGVRQILKKRYPGRYLPTNFPPWWVVHQQIQRWTAAGVFAGMAEDLRVLPRLAAPRSPSPPGCCSIHHGSAGRHAIIVPREERRRLRLAACSPSAFGTSWGGDEGHEAAW